MDSIQVKQIDGMTYEVIVAAASSTTHVVSVPPEYASKIGNGLKVEKLVQASFEFLLEREPNTSILRRFDLPVIARYFPEYETEIARMLRS